MQKISEIAHFVIKCVYSYIRSIAKYPGEMIASLYHSREYSSLSGSWAFCCMNNSKKTNKIGLWKADVDMMVI